MMRRNWRRSSALLLLLVAAGASDRHQVTGINFAGFAGRVRDPFAKTGDKYISQLYLR